MTTATILSLAMMAGAAALPSWNFDDASALKTWVPNAHMQDVRVEDGIVHATTTDWDPFFTCRDVSFEVSPWQFVVIRIKADRSGQGELFWSSSLEGEYGGLSQKKRTSFTIRAGDSWQDIVIVPFWHREGTIRQLRLDLYDDAHFEIDSIEVKDWAAGQAPLADVYSWEFQDGDPGPWHIHPSAGDIFAPPLALPIAGKGFVAVELSAENEAEGRVFWATQESVGEKSESFAIRGDGKSRYYNVEVQSYPTWKGELCAFGLRLPQNAGVRLKSVALCKAPQGPAELVVSYFGFENGVNRADRPARVLVHCENIGGDTAAKTEFRIDSAGMLSHTDVCEIETPKFGETADAVFEVSVDKAGTYAIRLEFQHPDGRSQSVQTALPFLEAMNRPKASYVPVPKPVETTSEICAYYFPGWGSDASWDCVRRVAPIRKPVLGYYDEAKVEVVDWQIKWARENGISCFLVDWYWIGGNQHLQHWFDAYRKARYRDMLKVAIMWANHNPPGTHSREDWRNVTREWIDHYFDLPAYYRLNGKPAVFIWDPGNIRNDLGGSEEVKAALAESQEMARAAGYEGIEFVSVNRNNTSAWVRMLEEEGYAGATSYHEWGKAADMADNPMRMHFDDLVESAPKAWEERDGFGGETVYYPLVESGWDSRPWHGAKARVIGGRTVAAFERSLHDAKAFSEARDDRMFVLGPLNEWGEGSYLEPNTEFGFQMYEAIRRVFGKDDPESWPLNIAPTDIGLGPYDFPEQRTETHWTFDKDAGGWSGKMGVGKLRVEVGNLCFRSVSKDPALHVRLRGISAQDFPRIQINMQLRGKVNERPHAQLFWSAGGSAIIEATSVRFPLIRDADMHTYEIDLAANPRWRGRITTLRFDPCDIRDVDIAIDSIRLIPAEE